MKTVPFRINGVDGRAHVIATQALKPQLRKDGLLEGVRIFEVDWANTGRYVKAFANPEYALCPYCNSSNNIDMDDLGFEEFECGNCEGTFTIPETLEALDTQNDEIKHGKNDDHAGHSHYRIMLRGEDGIESCLKNNVPAEFIDVMVDGYQTRYTEGQKVFAEPEETYADMIRNAAYYELEDR